MNYADWVHGELERAAREEINDYLAREAYNWASGEPLLSLDAERDLELTNGIAEALGQDRVRAIWADIDREI